MHGDPSADAEVTVDVIDLWADVRRAEEAMAEAAAELAPEATTDAVPGTRPGTTRI